MRYLQCKCGGRTAWTSMGVSACTRCPKCGSDLAESPQQHGEPFPHNFVTKYDQDTGVPYERCERCAERKDVLEKRGELDAPPLPGTEGGSNGTD